MNLPLLILQLIFYVIISVLICVPIVWTMVKLIYTVLLGGEMIYRAAKIFFVSILLFVGINSFAQKDTTKKADSLHWIRVDSVVHLSLSVFDNENRMDFSMGKDSAITIVGDTIRLLWVINGYLKELSEKYYAAIGVLDLLNLKALSDIYDKKYFTDAVKNYQKVRKNIPQK